MTAYKRKSCQITLNGLFLSLCIGLLTLLPTSNAHSESADELMMLAKAYILAHLDPQLKQPQVSITPLSSAAQKPNCEKPPQITYNTKQRVGNVTLTISCNQPAWRQYVNAKVTGLLPVIVAVQDLSAGQAIDEHQLTVDWRPNAQVTNNHLINLGAIVIPRTVYLSILNESVSKQNLLGIWHRENDLTSLTAFYLKEKLIKRKIHNAFSSF